MTTSYDPSGLKRSLAAAQAKIARLTQRAEKAEAERDRQYDENVHRIAEQMKAETERDANAKWLGELLASVHRDGGHYQSKHGDSKAVADAHMIVSRLHASDESRVQVAAAFEAAAEKCDVVFQDGVGDLIRGIGDEIRRLTPADALSALSKMLAEAERKGMQRAISVTVGLLTANDARKAILAEMEKLK